MKIIDADKLHYKQVYIQTEKGLRPALVVFAKEIRKMPTIKLPREVLENLTGKELGVRDGKID